MPWMRSLPGGRYLFACSALRSETYHISHERYCVMFSALHAPIAHLHPGDTAITKCLDSRGCDETGMAIFDADNVLTGPFYIEGSEPGDTLAVRLDRVRFNRDWVWSKLSAINRWLEEARQTGIHSLGRVVRTVKQDLSAVESACRGNGASCRWKVSSIA